jgi:hypothetical protein
MRSDPIRIGAGWRRRPVLIVWSILSLVATAMSAEGCPFCDVVGRSLAERRDSAAAVAVGERVAAATLPANENIPSFEVRQVLRGTATVGETVGASVEGPCRGLAILFLEAAAGGSRWTAIAADEALLGHVAAAPDTSVAADKRLAWFATRLEHANPAIAADAFAEFGLAPFSAVRAAGAGLDADVLEAWMAEPGIDERRRGLYGLLLGIVAERTPDIARRRRAIDRLHQAIERPASDFRAGLDGIMGGILVAEAGEGLDFLERRGLLDAAASPIDQRHLLRALRFAWESLPESIPRQRIAAATERLAVCPAVAADAVTDLARYEVWGAADAVASLWDTAGRDDPLIRRAIAGYLGVCPTPRAKAHLDRLRAADPDRLKAAVDAASLPAR